MYACSFATPCVIIFHRALLISLETPPSIIAPWPNIDTLSIPSLPSFLELPTLAHPLIIQHHRAPSIIIPHLPLNIPIPLSTLIKNRLLPIRQANLCLALHIDRQNIINPSSNQETAHSPNPNRNPKTNCYEEGRHENE